MTKTRVNEIDLLRFFAALAVVFFHYAFCGYAKEGLTIMPYPLLSEVSKYGTLGVYLFFIISGFVILMTAANGSLKDFAISRIVRLYPAFWVCCTITFMVTLAIGEPWFSVSIPQYLVNMTMLNSLFSIKAVDSVYWTLFAELKFYGLVALVLLVRRINQAQIFLIFWLVASIVLGIHPIWKLGGMLIIEYSSFFIAGATYYLIWSKGLSMTRVAIIATSWLMSVSQSLKELREFKTDYHASINNHVVIGIVTAFFIVMLLVSLRRTGVIGRTRWLLVGGITYPLYLLHQNVGYMVFNVAYPAVNVHLLFWGAIASSMVFAYAIHIFVEKQYSSSMKEALNNLANYIQRLIIRSDERTETHPEFKRYA
jgi:peptidoglycan/LPS O-acetylase OafA/YrhL